jgi:hypothetical protein
MMRFFAVTERKVIGVKICGVEVRCRILRSFSPRAACGLDCGFVVSAGAGSAHEFTPFVDLFTDERRKTLGRAHDRFRAKRQHALSHLRRADKTARIGRNFIDDVNRRASRRHQTPPLQGIEARQRGLRDSRNIRRAAEALRAGDA